MSSAAQTIFGVTLAIGATNFGTIRSISGPSRERDTIDTSHAGSTARTRTFLPGMRDSGELEVELLYTPDAYEAAIAKFDSNAVESVVVTYPNGDVDTCDGFVTSVPPDGEYEGERTFSMTIKFTGVATFTKGS